MVGGQGGYAHIDHFFADLFDDAAVLGEAALGDVHVRHDLDAGNDRQREVDGRRGHFVEGTIDAIADFEILFEGFEVDVRGLFLDCLVEDKVHVADDRGGVGFGLEVCGVDGIASELQLAEDILHRLAFAAVTIIDFLFDEVVWRDQQMDFAAEGEAEVFEGLRVEWIDQHDGEAGFIELDGQGTVEAGGAGRHQGEQGLWGRPVADIDHFGAQF